MTTAAIPRAIYTGTLRALVAPRRLLPILVVSIPLLTAQVVYAPAGELRPLAVAALTLLSFLLVAPAAWRLLAPRGRPLSWLRLAVYATLGLATVVLVGNVLPLALGFGDTYMPGPLSVLITTALFWAGGWGLGRDIELEESLQAASARAAALEREAERARLLALRSHFDPHFLFNTLNAIAEWCREDGEVAEKAILRLSDMLRTVLEGTRGASWPLERELALVEHLFELHRTRDPSLFEGRIHVADQVAAAGVQVPPLILLPLAENAMKHGPAAGHRGPVSLEVLPAGEGARVLISNPGAFEGRRNGGRGLEMVERRLALAYEGRASLRLSTVTTTDPATTCAEVELPSREPAGGSV